MSEIESTERPPIAAPASPAHSRLWWIVRGLEVRLRFFALAGLAAAVIAGWPWLRGAWSHFVSHGHSPSASVSADSEFFCPMDPGVRSAWPAICPICNMDLVPRKKADAILLPEGVVARMQFSPYRVQLAGIRTVPVQRRTTDSDSEGSSNELTVPASAVLHRGDDSIVYVESMPGMFDGTFVRLGPREGDAYPVLDGLKEGQRVAAAGSFLIDAESRLNPNVATQYFGANAQATGRNNPPPLPARGAPSGKEPVSAEEKELAARQRICPVTELPLGSMGRPIAVTVQGKKVLLCCRGCEKAIQASPEKFLARLKATETPGEERPKR